MAYVLIYNNPDRHYLIGFKFDTWEEVTKKLRECVSRGMLDIHFQIVKDDDPQAVWLYENKHVF